MVAFKDWPANGDVTLGYPDGYYVHRTLAEINVLVVGPMPHAPGEIAVCFPGFELSTIDSLPMAPEQAEFEKVRLARGFIAIRMKAV